MRHKSKIAISLEDDHKLCKRILDFFGWKMLKSWDGLKNVVVLKSEKHVVFYNSKDEVDAVKLILQYDTLYNTEPSDEDHFVQVENPFYGKSLDEIKIMLDLLGNEH